MLTPADATTPTTEMNEMDKMNNVMDGLRIVVNPTGWLGRPHLTVISGSKSVLTAHAGSDGAMHAWLVYWGLFGVYKTKDVDQKFVADLMGWTGDRK